MRKEKRMINGRERWKRSKCENRDGNNRTGGDEEGKDNGIKAERDGK